MQRLIAAEEIRTLMARYCRGFDDQDEALFDSISTEKATFQLAGRGEASGRSEIRVLVRSIWPLVRTSHHHITTRFTPPPTSRARRWRSMLSAGAPSFPAFDQLHAHGVAVETNAHGRYLGDPLFEPVLAELDRRRAVVFVHPTSPPNRQQVALGRPRPMLEFLFDTTRTVSDCCSVGRSSDIRICGWSSRAAGQHSRYSASASSCSAPCSGARIRRTRAPEPRSC